MPAADEHRIGPLRQRRIDVRMHAKLFLRNRSSDVRQPTASAHGRIRVYVKAVGNGPWRTGLTSWWSGSWHVPELTFLATKSHLRKAAFA